MATAQTGEAPLRFDFGGTTPTAGTVAVNVEQTFDVGTGYGFEPGSMATFVPRRGGGYVTGKTPFMFSVQLPAGDYRVTVRLGGRDGASQTTVKAESRRLMLENVSTEQDIIVTHSFIVNVRTPRLPPPPPNATGGSEIRLHEREIGSLNWDEKLTLAFSGRAPKLVNIEIERVVVPRLFLLGDSTVTDQPAEPYASWGQMLPRFFAPSIAVANYAEGGETLKSFFTDLRLDKVLSEIRPGDWAFIQFGHNDEKSQWPQTYAPAETTYRQYLRTYIAEVRRLGGHPVLVTSMQRLSFDASGHIANTHGGYPDAVRAVATQEKVPLIDLTTLSTTLFEAMGKDRAAHAFAMEGRDGTHHSDYCAYELARCVVKAMRDLSLPLERHLRDVPPFDPSHPDKAEDLTFLAE